MNSLIKKALFWGIGLFFLISNFIRTFINEDFGESVRVFFRPWPTSIKVLIVIVSTIFMVWLFPYKKKNKKTKK